MRGSSIKKNLMFLYLGLLFSLSACGINLQTGPSPNIEDNFKAYNDDKILVKDSQGYSEALSYILANNVYEISGSGTLWGDVEVLKVDIAESLNCQLNGVIQVSQGNYKIIIINKNSITVLVEDEVSFEKSVILQEGMLIIKIVGKPVDFDSLDIQIAIPESKGNINCRLPLAEQYKGTENAEIETEVVEESRLLEFTKIEEGEFQCVSYLQEGNILLSGKLVTLNGNKVLLHLDSEKEFDLYIKIKCKLKAGNYELVLQDGKGNQKSIVSDEESWEGNIMLDKGENIIILNGSNASFSSVIIESNSEEISLEDVKH